VGGAKESTAGNRAGRAMDQLSVISDSAERAEAISQALSGVLATRCLMRSEVPHTEPATYSVVDIDLTNGTHLDHLRRWLALRPRHGKAIFVVERGVRFQAVQALAVGATDLVNRPADRRALLVKLFGDIAALAGEAAKSAASDGVSAGIGALQNIFLSTVAHAEVELDVIRSAGETVVADIESEGLVRWIEAVRMHHSLTYQHCLLVTGVVVMFGQQLGFSSKDRRKLALAGMLHDIGKAKIPVALLEKPGPLTEDEQLLMRQHPQLGFAALQGVAGLDRDMLDIVLHHHEYLDGSGYPEGIGASALSDLARMMTIADIFGALIERRAYRAPLPPKTAYRILQDMGAKLDADLVREFGPIARTA
jgi:putative nucleotidyltransferase with HDIG domain